MDRKTTYDRYQVIEELGRGAMGVVFKAFDPRLNRSVALKVMRRDRHITPEFVRRFADEAVAIGQLSHQNIVGVFDRGEDHGTLFMAMELLSGRSLKEIIAARRLSHQEAVNIGVQVAEALDYAHKQGIIHRDIKPSNLILLESGLVKITDFGIARIEDSDATVKTQIGQVMGTPCYMSPEQSDGKALDGRSDLFSLGVILYEIVSGKKPFAGDTLLATYAAVQNQDPAPPYLLDKAVPRRLSQAIMKSLAKNREERFQSGQEMALELKQCLQRRRSDHLAGKTAVRRFGAGRILASTLILAALIIFAAVGVKHLRTPPAPTVTIPSPTATLTVDSDPSDAQVFINGDLRGRTPMQLALGLGKYEIKISKSHHYSWEAQINLDQPGPVPIFGNLLPIENGEPQREE